MGRTLGSPRAPTGGEDVALRRRNRPDPTVAELGGSAEADGTQDQSGGGDGE
jgi:hypothetical protein